MHGEVSATRWIWPKLHIQHTNCCSAGGYHVLIHLTLHGNNAEVLLLLPQLCRLHTVRKVGAAVDGNVVFLADPAQVCHWFPNYNVGGQLPPQLSKRAVASSTVAYTNGQGGGEC